MINLHEMLCNQKNVQNKDMYLYFHPCHFSIHLYGVPILCILWRQYVVPRIPLDTSTACLITYY